MFILDNDEYSMFSVEHKLRFGFIKLQRFVPSFGIDFNHKYKIKLRMEINIWGHGVQEFIKMTCLVM